MRIGADWLNVTFVEVVPPSVTVTTPHELTFVEQTVIEYTPLTLLLPPSVRMFPLILVVTLPELELFETMYVPVPPLIVTVVLCPYAREILL